MFDQALPYKLVQIKGNKSKNESFMNEFIYKFYRHNYRCCIKYIVSIKSYEDGFLTLDYYPKINLTPKPNSAESLQDLRYRILTKQHSFGIIGGTILDIMQEVQTLTGAKIWGFLAANLVSETTNVNNKRYNVYKEVLRRTYRTKHSVFGNKNYSAIFVIPLDLTSQAELIVKRYEEIFSETY